MRFVAIGNVEKVWKIRIHLMVLSGVVGELCSPYSRFSFVCAIGRRGAFSHTKKL